MKKVKKQSTFFTRAIAVLVMVALFLTSLALFGTVKTFANSEKEYTPAIATDFSTGVEKDGLINSGVTFDETLKSAVFNGNSFMYYQPDLSDEITGSFTVMIGAYLKAQNTSGYIFNSGFYANGIACELNYNNLRFYFGNDTELAFSLKSILSSEETFYLITMGYSAEEDVIFYRVQSGTDLASEKSGSAYSTATAPFSHATYGLTLGAQSRLGQDTVNYATCKIKTFNVYSEFINDETFIDNTFNTLAGIEEPGEPIDPDTPSEPVEPVEPEEPKEPVAPETEEPTLTTFGVVGYMLASMLWLFLFGTLLVKFILSEDVKAKVITGVLTALLVIAYFVALYFTLTFLGVILL